MKKIIAAAGLVGALAVAGVGASAGAANAATPAPATGGPHVATVQDGGCTSSWTKGWTSVDLVINNNTSFPLTFDGALSGPSTGHWNDRPAETLQPGQCEVVNAYAPTDVHIFNLNVVYSTPWGDYMPFQGMANCTSPGFNPDVFQNQPTYHSSDESWSGAIDSRYSITSSGQIGNLHTHYTLNLS
jgi:hypothetical protein